MHPLYSNKNKYIHYKKSVIYQYDLNGKYLNEYPNCRIAGKENYIYSRCIEKCCRGEMQSVGEYQWRRVDPSTPKDDISPLKIETSFPNSPIEIEQYTLDGEFIKKYPSIKAAADALGVDPKSIRQALKGRQRSAQGYIWKRIN